VMRNQICAIAHSVSQLERRIKVGTELVEEVRGDLQDRVRQLRSVLGDQAPILASLTTSPHHPDHHMLVMTNKTPFRNEQSQVYQLDFGGRVTQESAKNFQIEYADKQVMQFGRIESGSYTLDFRRPFCAAQAFAVALASITQRLK